MYNFQYNTKHLTQIYINLSLKKGIDYTLFASSRSMKMHIQTYYNIVLMLKASNFDNIILNVKSIKVFLMVLFDIILKNSGAVQRECHPKTKFKEDAWLVYFKIILTI